MKYLMLFENFNSYDIQDVAWLYFLHYIRGKMEKEMWENDNRMGTNFVDSIEKFNCVKFEDGFYYSTKECEKIINKVFGSKTFEEAVNKKMELLEFDTKSYEISTIPYNLYLKKYKSISNAFDKIYDKIIKHFNSMRCLSSIIESLLKHKQIKEWNYKECFNYYFPNKIPNKIKIYRGLKQEYDENRVSKYTCWSLDKSQGERFAKYFFSGGFQMNPSLSKNPTLLEAEVDYDDVLIFIGGKESEVIMKEPVKITNIIKL